MKRSLPFSESFALRFRAIITLAFLCCLNAPGAQAQCILLNDDFSSAPTLAASNTDGAWYPDRYPPAAFTSDAGRLKISISAADGAQLRPSGYSSAFYNTQGRKFNQCGKCVTVLKGDLYIPSDWAGNHRRSDMWATAYDISDAISFYPIIGFRNVTGANPQMSYWDGAAWVELGAPSNGYDTWYALEIRLNGADVEYLIDNAVVGTVSSGGSVYFGNIIMQAYNFNDNTLTGGAYDPGPDNSYDAFWDNLVTTGTGGNVVTNLNTGETFCKIQAAIDAPLTLAGHTIEAGPGTYNENVLINKSDLTLRSTGGKGVTTIQGTLAGGNYGTVAIASGTNGVTLGQSGQGFTIIGFDGTGGIEAAAVYLLGAHTDITIEGNEIRADGDHGLLSNYNAAIDGILINDNMFTGKTFLGAEPGGCGFATQFDPGNNVPRQLVTMGGGATVTASKNVTFTNNMVTGTTGGFNSTDGCEQGNQLVTIDVIGADIRNNIFNGVTTRGAYSLRTRGKLTSIGCNTFHSDFLHFTCAHIYFGSPAPLTGASPSTLAGVASVNAFPDGGAFLTPDHPGSWIIFKDMAQAVAAAAAIGAGQAPVPASPALSCPVTNTNTGNVFCSIQDGIEASMTLSGHVLAVPACSYAEFVDAVTPGKDITLAPGASPGCVTITGGLTLGSGDALDMEIDGTSACTDYDRFAVNGAVTLGGATLTLTLGYTPSPGHSYTLIANDGADPVSGQFAQGATVSSGGYVFSVNYAGGDGNDVVLTSCGTGKVQNTDTGEWFCSIQDAIDDAQTLDGHTLSVNAGTFNENVTVSKELTINGAGNGSNPATNTVLTPASSCSGTGITVSAANVTLNNMYVTDYQDAVALGGVSAPALTNMALIDYCRYGVRLDGANSSVSLTGTDIQRTAVLAGTVGIRAGTANAVNGMTIDDCTINGNIFGMAIFQSSTPVAFDDITIKNSTISNNTQKGLYFEKLSNALLENLTMDNNGTDAAYGFNNGIDINLKYDDYSNITIKDCDITNSGSTGTAADPENPAAIAIKARDDASSYNTIPATLTDVTIKNNRITGPQNGIRFGEFGKINNGPSSVTVEGNDLSYAFANKAVIRRTNDDVNLVCNWHGSTSLPVILATFADAGTGNTILSNILDSGGDGNPAVGFQPSGTCTCPSGNLVTNTNTSETFCTIQAAIDDAQTLGGHTLSVGAGTYIEDITVNKSLTILGPNAAIDPCTGSRVAEAVVVPKTKDIGVTVLFYIAANTDNVSIKGFTLNGDNPALTSGFTSTNGADIDAAEGVATYETGVDNLVVQNNIFKNLSFFGVTHYDYPAGVASSGHDISNNKFMDMGTYDAGSGISYWGGGVLLYNNAYARVSNNCMTNVRIGVQTGNYYNANPGAATYQLIEDNTIQARRRGIFHNLFYSAASPYTLDDNTITALDHAGESYWDGILISSHQGVASTTSDNVIDGSAITGKPTEGIEVWNVRSTAPATISGGSVTGVSTGLFVNNYEGYVSDAGEGAHTVVSGLTVTDCPVGAKIFDSPSSTLHAAVNATIQTDCHFSHSSGGTTGILVAGAAASATIQDNSASFHGFTTGIDVDAGSATIDNNHIYDNTTGIRFTNGGSGTVTDNDFTGATNNDTDLRLDASAGTVGADGGNHFAGSVYGVDNQSAAVVDAENNYWNDATGPGAPPYAFGSGAEITANVDYCPFYGAPGGPALPAANCSFLFSGTILWEHDGTSGVKDATVNLTGAGSGSGLTDVNGDYLIALPYAAGNYTLTPVKSINKLNGVTVADALAIQQHVAGITPIASLYKKVAADVNKTNSITTFDATIINQSLLGNPAAMAQFKTSWRFSPQSHTMVDPPWGFPESISLTGVTVSQTGQDFYGIKTGDVTAGYANPANFGAGDPLVLNVEDQTLQTGAVATLEFRANQLDDLAAFQFVLKFNPGKLALAEIIPQTGLPLTTDNFGTYNLAEGEIRAVWSQAEGLFLEEAAPVFALKFNVLQGGGKLSEAIFLDETELPALAYNSVMAESKAELNFSGTTAVGDLNGASGLQLLQNRPNPFSGATAIAFVLPEAGEAQLRVFDAAGRLLAERKGQYPAGKSEETFDLSGASGVLWYELTTQFGVLARKMAATQK